MIRLGALVLAAAALAQPLAAFTPTAPGDATETARRTDPPGRYAVASGAAAPLAAPPVHEMQGTRTRIAWQSPLESETALLQDLTDQLEAAGFTQLFSCQARSCGGFDFRLALPVLPMPDMFVNLAEFQYLSAERADPQALASVLVSQTQSGAFAQLSLTTQTPVETPPQAQPDAAAEAPAAGPAQPPLPEATSDLPAPVTGDLAQVLERAGRAPLDGLDFAVGSATLATPDAPALAALAGWLTQDRSRRIALVGHSDWTGTPELNVKLSRARAQAVANALAALGAARSQITVAGAGPFAPRRPNDTPEGRSANRRVEAVLLPPAS